MRQGWHTINMLHPQKMRCIAAKKDNLWTQKWPTQPQGDYSNTQI